MNTTQKNYTQKDMNPKYVIIHTSNGKIVRPNPNYDPNKCGKCGGRKGIFHNCK